MDSTESVGKEPISKKLSENQDWLKQTLADCSDINFQLHHYGSNFELGALVVYCESLIQYLEINYLKKALQDLVPQIIGPATMVTLEEVILFFDQNGASSRQTEVVEKLEDAVKKIMYGHVVIIFDGWDKALCFHSICMEKRSISEPINESVVRGPHDSTVEDLTINLGLLRNRMKSEKFKIHKCFAAGETETEVVYGYLTGAVNPETLAEFKKRFELAIKHEILESSYIEELIEDSSYSPFPQYQYTERTDVAVAALLDGKIIVLVGGTPGILLCPGLFSDFFKSPEDYYVRTVFASLIRILRVVTFLLALTLPALYIAFSNFDSELIPTVLLLAVLDSREGIPFPTFIEAMLMEFLFEILREAGVRLPKPVGSAVSIVGALVIGQAAIIAKIASPVVIIIVALTGIASFSLPDYNMAIGIRILRFILMVFAAILGVFGLMIGLLFIFLHLVSLRSLGQPYMAPLAPFRFSELRDVLVRAPLKRLIRSPRNQHMHKFRKD
ncbi:spore germination protein [Paenibacillus psychroresistens]|uniref:Spore germination protein n=1 Tax=Paenibacillus psychroresistens TaxID=1778678 RepID=A0A6B8RKK3_9BACL|nr:spore germination protein [Paenibacillus psychroresistens]QGQ96820.1 spore germination protein [Paenibacillus psychroresistens]